MSETTTSTAFPPRGRSRADEFLPEFEEELAGTRKLLERLPEDKLDWRAHPRSNTIGWVASHLANLPSWTGFTVNQDSIDINPAGASTKPTPVLATRAEVLATFDRNVADARAALAGMSDEAWWQPWSLLSGGQTIFTMPKGTVLRKFVLRHIVHHRAILTVYYRLNEVPVPGFYGPSADEG